MNCKDWIEKEFDKTKDWVVVTGATSGIGLEYLKYFCSMGCNCIVVSNEMETMQDLEKKFQDQYKTTIKSFFCELSSVQSIIEVCEKISTGYSVRVLVNNAGFGLKGRFLDIDLKRYLDIATVNSSAQTIFSYYLLPEMISSKCGVHINIATINVVSPIPFNAVYTATKFYVFAYALAISQEYKDSGVIFQVVLPGTTNTPFHEKQGSHPSAMTMQPEHVVESSLKNIKRLICIPNRMDALFYPFFILIPIRLKMLISTWIAKKRLGLKHLV